MAIKKLLSGSDVLLLLGLSSAVSNEDSLLFPSIGFSDAVRDILNASAVEGEHKGRRPSGCE